MDYDQNITAYLIRGQTIKEIEDHLESLNFDIIKKLMLVYDCRIEDLIYNIARAKGIKCSQKKDLSPGKQSGQRQAGTSLHEQNLFFCL